MSINLKGKHKVFVGVSGGVDSSVAAALLKEEGYDVTGVFIKIWHKELSQCDWRAEMQDAMRVCAHLAIPFQMIDLSDVYAERVINYLVTSYQQGLTPNPDVMCNNAVKFGAFYDWAMQQGVDYVATGHYAQTDGNGVLTCAIDPAKDQSYFLWNVPKDRLKKTLFPIGSYEKKDVRLLAQRYNLPTASKPDSQGLCFIGDVDVKTFLHQRLKTEPGNVLNEAGEIVGTHNGALLYTAGERHGFKVTTHAPHTKPHYVIDRNIDANTITVTEDSIKQNVVTELELMHVNLFTEIPNELVDVVVRYHGERFLARIIHTENTFRIMFETPIQRVACGQSAVLYSQNTCIGGGSIANVF